MFNYVLSLSLFLINTDISAILKKVPVPRDLLDLLACIKHKWKMIGVALEVEHCDLEGLSQSNKDNSTRLYEVLEAWMNTRSTDVTWETVITAAEGSIVDQKSTAVKIQQFLSEPKVYSKYLGKRTLSDAISFPFKFSYDVPLI